MSYLTDADVNALVADDLAQREIQRRNEVARKARVDADMKHLARVNARHPVEAPLSAKEQARRNELANESLRKQAEKLAENDRKWRASEAAVVRQQGPRMQTPGSEGFSRKL